MQHGLGNTEGTRGYFSKLSISKYKMALLCNSMPALGHEVTTFLLLFLAANIPDHCMRQCKIKGSKYCRPPTVKVKP